MTSDELMRRIQWMRDNGTEVLIFTIAEGWFVVWYARAPDGKAEGGSTWRAAGATMAAAVDLVLERAGVAVDPPREGTSGRRDNTLHSGVAEALSAGVTGRGFGMDVYRVEFRGVRHSGEPLPPTSRLPLFDGFPAGVTPELVAAIRGALMTHVGRNLGWDDVQVEGVEHRGRALAAVCRD